LLKKLFNFFFTKIFGTYLNESGAGIKATSSTLDKHSSRGGHGASVA